MAREVAHHAVRVHHADRVVVTTCGLRIEWDEPELPRSVEIWKGEVTCPDCLSGARATVTP